MDGVSAEAEAEAEASIPAPPQFGLVIVGAGPHALALALRLLCGDPEDVTTESDKARSCFWAARLALRHGVRGGGDARCTFERALSRLCIVDPSGAFMSTWDGMFSALEIAHLRSPSFLQLDPLDTDGLRGFVAAEVERSRGERGAPTKARDTAASVARHLHPAPEAMFARPVSQGKGKSRGSGGGMDGAAAGGAAATATVGFASLNQLQADDFAMPSTPAFAAHCQALLDRHGGALRKRVVRGLVRVVTPVMLPHSGGGADGAAGDGGGNAPRVSHLRLTLESGHELTAAHVVMAVGAQASPRVPDWVQSAAAVASAAALAPAPATAPAPPACSVHDHSEPQATHHDARCESACALAPGRHTLAQFPREHLLHTCQLPELAATHASCSAGVDAGDIDGMCAVAVAGAASVTTGAKTARSASGLLSEPWDAYSSRPGPLRCLLKVRASACQPIVRVLFDSMRRSAKPSRAESSHESFPPTVSLTTYRRAAASSLLAAG
jgi:hypothetical protein